jgi:hypothetical protein
MRRRCYNPNDGEFDLYGGRGITICQQWLDAFENFYIDMGDPPSAKHSIDRIDPDGNYEPGNCRWVTGRVQRQNQRRQDVLEYEHGGESHTLNEWAEITGMPYARLHARVKVLGWTFDKAIGEPKRYS